MCTLHGEEDGLMHFRFILSLLILIALTTTIIASDNQVYSLARISLTNDSDIETVQSLHLDQAFRADDYVDVVIEADRLNILDEAGLTYNVEIRDMTAFYQSRNAGRDDGVGSMGGYRTLAEIYLVMDSIATENPTIVQPRWSIGQSLEGRDIYVMKISDNPDVDEDEAEIFYNATIHAREVITPEVLIYYMRYLTNNYGTDPQVTNIVDNREMFFTLCMNPDGYYHNEVIAPGGGGMWRKNRRDNGNGTWGIDLNRNYGYQWGFDDAGSSPFGGDETYRGTGPFSEPESQVIRDFTISRDFKVVVDYHSYSNLILWPWGYNCSQTLEHYMYIAVGAVAANHNGYGIGNCCGINGYTGDWHYGERVLKPKIMEFLVEVGGPGDGFWPHLSRITPLVEENLMPNIIYALYAGDTTFLEVPVAPVLDPIGEIAELPYELTWSHEDTANPAVGFDIWQFSGYEKIIDDLADPDVHWTELWFEPSWTRSHSGQFSYWSTDGSPIDSRLTTAAPILVAHGDSIKFWTWYDILDDTDYGYVEVTTNGIEWVSIPGNITTDSDPYGYNLGNGITGSSGGWVLGLFDLSEYEGNFIAYRFRYVSGEFASEGWYVDDIYPVDVYDAQIRLAESLPETSFEITSLENGEHYFQVFAVDAEGQRSEGSEREWAHIYVAPYIRGDADGSGGVDIDDVVFLINFIFAGGEAPDPYEAGDADCTGAIDIDDVVYVIAYIFSGGPEPGDPNGDGTPDC